MTLTEEKLFELKVKPALFTGIKSNYISSININDYFIKYLGNGVLLSHHEIPELGLHDNIKLGEILGYYPEACKLLFDGSQQFKGYNEFINFGGVKFNTAWRFDESLEWCLKQYKDKMLEYMNTITCIRSTIDVRNGVRNIIYEITGKLEISKEGITNELWT